MVIYQQTTITLVAERKNRRLIRPIEVRAGKFWRWVKSQDSDLPPRWNEPLYFFRLKIWLVEEIRLSMPVDMNTYPSNILIIFDRGFISTYTYIHIIIRYNKWCRTSLNSVGCPKNCVWIQVYPMSLRLDYHRRLGQGLSDRLGWDCWWLISRWY